MALHEQCVGKTSEWYTPSPVFAALGCIFDLDAASPGAAVVPWIPARKHLTSHALELPWEGFTWLNAPFGARNGLVPWLVKFIQHGDGVCLVPDRTSAPWWQAWAPRMDVILFVRGKIKFIDANGTPGGSPAQGTALGALGPRGVAALHRAADQNFGIALKPFPGGCS
jgi:hypothetical protein